jgi:hypothetical protein
LSGLCWPAWDFSSLAALGHPGRELHGPEPLRVAASRSAATGWQIKHHEPIRYRNGAWLHDGSRVLYSFLLRLSGEGWHWQSKPFHIGYGCAVHRGSICGWRFYVCDRCDSEAVTVHRFAGKSPDSPQTLGKDDCLITAHAKSFWIGKKHHDRNPALLERRQQSIA